MQIQLLPFSKTDFKLLTAWVDSEEMLVTIAGREFVFPLTDEQLTIYLAKENSVSFTVLEVDSKRKIGHAELILIGDGLVKIDKLIIGEKGIRGQGLGQAVVTALTDYAFEKLDAELVELNVFDWNEAGIRCYEKCGFQLNLDKQAYFQMGEQQWLAVNMNIHKSYWSNRNK